MARRTLALETPLVRRQFILSMETWVRLFRRAMPELAGVPNREFAASVEWALSDRLQRWSFALALGVQTIPMLWVVSNLFLRLIGSSSAVMVFVVGVLIGGVVALCIWFVNVYWFFRGLLKLAVRQELIRRGWFVCVRCGYDLHAQTEPRCPECGADYPELDARIKQQQASKRGRS